MVDVMRVEPHRDWIDSEPLAQPMFSKRNIPCSLAGQSCMGGLEMRVFIQWYKHKAVHKKNDGAPIGAAGQTSSTEEAPCRKLQ